MISVQGLSYCYRRSQRLALDNVSIDIPAGAAFGLLGPNGAGKSTLLSLLNGLLPIRSGSVRIAGLDGIEQIDRIKTLSAFVPQDYAFYSTLSGRENLNFFAGIYRLDATTKRERIDYCVGVCQLQDILDRRADEYSGGMKRRLNLALGLLNAPQILYLDEPTVGVDALSRQCIIDAIRQLTQAGITIVYTSHYMEEVQAICSEIGVINHGRVILRDSVENLGIGAARLEQIYLDALKGDTA